MESAAARPDGAGLEHIQNAAAEGTRGQPAIEQGTSPVANLRPPFDAEAALSKLGGEIELMREIIVLFSQESPKWMAQLRAAVASGNAADVRRTAHTLKGSAANFEAAPVCEAAQHLETMGKNNNLARATEACDELEAELARLLPALAAAYKT